MLEKYFDLDNYKIRMSGNVDWYPRAKEREKWEALPMHKKEEIVKEAEPYIDYAYPSLLATNYYKLYTQNSREPYMKPYRQRREVLSTLVMAECVEHKGRFLSDIINGIYLVCEESTWIDPAHSVIDYSNGTGPRDVYPNAESKMIDLWVGITSVTMAWIYYLLKEELDYVNPLICRYMESTLEKRVLTPYIERDDIWWLTAPHNWNPDMNHKIALTAVLIEKDSTRIQKILEKSLRSVNYFFEHFPFDGGCEEGTGYWHSDMAVEYLEWMNYVSYGAIDAFREPQLQNIAKYEYHMYVGNNNYVSVADAHMNMEKEHTGILYKVGKLSGIKELVAMASQRGLGDVKTQSFLPAKLESLFSEEMSEVLEQYKHWEINFPKTFWYDSIQTLIWRERETIGGLFFTIKGGHNDELHNHNDVGNFALFNNCEPVIIDAGIGEYSEKAFSALRYTVWEFNSKYHNVPQIGKVEQKNGRRYRAIKVEHSGDKVSMDIAPAYGDESILQWRREVTYNRDLNEITICEFYEFTEEKEIELHFMLCEEPQIQEGRIVFSQGIEMVHDSADVSYEEIENLYDIMKHRWGRIFRLNICTHGKHGEYSYRFKCTV